MVETTPLVSVIVPAFNRVAYIDETLRSVLDQSYPAVELLVVDDGSSDGTYEKLLSYGEQIKLLTHPEHANRGQSASINQGLLQARGDYIAILDSDDYWDLSKLSKQVAFLQAHPDIGLVYANGYYVDAASKILWPFHAENHCERSDPNRVLLDCYMLLPQSSLVRSSVYQQVGLFEESFRAAQDHDMLIRIAEVTKMAYMPDYLFFYRKHGDSISSKGQEVRWSNGFKILERARQRYPYRPLTLRKRAAVLNFRLGQVYWSQQRQLKALPYLLKSALLDPLRALAVVSGREQVR